MTEARQPLWPAATSTGIGSMPGTDARWAATVAFDTVSLPFVPELPDRGPGADLVGRGIGLLAELYADLQPSGWRATPRPGLDTRRALDYLERDLDACGDAASGHAGPVKVQACGPWTLAASLELQRGGQALADAGAVTDLAESLAEGLREHVAQLRARVPGLTQVVVQVDEPMLPAILAGHVRTASGFGTLRTPDEREVTGALSVVLRAVEGAFAGVHCCAPDIPLRLLRKAGAEFVSMDVTKLVASRLDDELGEVLEDGMGLVAGAVPTTGEGATLAGVVRPVRELWSRLGLAAGTLQTVAVSPACGVPGVTPELAREALERSRKAAEELAGD